MANEDWTEVVASESSAWDREAPLEGKLVNKREGVGPNESHLYTIKTKEGEVSVWGSTVLDTKFADIPVNSEVRIEPQGLVKSPKTGREYLDFKVFFKLPTFQEVTNDDDIFKDIPF